MDRLVSIAEELKNHRLSKQIPLVQVSSVTRIRLEFLEAIEAGQFAILPRPYIRAFLREYAEAVELNPDMVLHKYESAVQESSSQSKDEDAPARTDRPLPVSFPPLWLARRGLIPLAFVIFSVLILLYVFNSSLTSTSSNVINEIPFDRVVREAEATLAPPDRATSPPQLQPLPSSDSLRLEMTTLDSLWIQIVIDGTRTEEYLFPPDRKRTWLAHDQFSLTIGNAGGATFRLNGRDLGALGRRGAVLRNAIISHAGLEQP